MADIAARIRGGNCEITGLPFDLAPHPFHSTNPWGPSLDRHNNQLGYTPENTKVVVTMLNVAKGEFHHNDLHILALAILNRSREGIQ